MMANEKIGWSLLAISLSLYGYVYLTSPSLFFTLLFSFFHMFMRIVPLIFLIILLMSLSNYFLDAYKISKWLGNKSSWKKWIIASFAGVISVGPIFMWYPLLKDLKEHGTSNGVIACFIYSRGVKPLFFPIMLYYFGILYTFYFCIFLIFFSILMGLIMEKICP